MNDAAATILVVDDDAFNREGSRLYLEQQGYSVLEAGDEESAWQIVVRTGPQIALLDIVIPAQPGEPPVYQDSAGLRLARRLKAYDPSLGIVLFSAYEDRGNDVWEMVQEGIRGLAYKLKGCHPIALLYAIREVQAGRIIIDPAVTTMRVTISDLQNQLTSQERPWVEDALQRFDGLTSREMEVAHRLAASHTTRGIAEALGIEEKTVENYVSNVYAKLALNQMRVQAPNLRPIVILAKAFMIFELKGKQ